MKRFLVIINRNKFSKLSFITVGAVYFLILVGGIVRSTGSGMGCPDWPRCFGNWVPPTEESQLPVNYQDVYAQKRAAKNEKFASYLEKLGYKAEATKIRNDKTILVEARFNKFKTWTEYLNRLTGVAIGGLIILTFAASFKYIKKDTLIFVLSFLALILVIFQGWLGSVVVSTNLMPWIVTVHMLLALVIVAVLIWAAYRSLNIEMRDGVRNIKVINLVLLLSILTIVTQIVLGTQVREAIDGIAASYEYRKRGEWISQLGLEFYIHRSYSILILIIHLILVYVLLKGNSSDKEIYYLGKILLIMIVVEIVTGVIMAYINIPAFIQPVHLLLASVIFGVQFVIFLTLNSRRYKTSGLTVNLK